MTIERERKMQNKYTKKQYFVNLNNFDDCSFMLQTNTYKVKVIVESFRAVIYHLHKIARQMPRAALTTEHMFDIITLSLP